MQHSATGHHLRRIRAKAAAGTSTRGPVHSATQEIPEVVKFLVLLHETYQRTAVTWTQQDVDEWLATGPTTRTAIRTFFLVAKKARLNTLVVQHRSAKTSRVHGRISDDTAVSSPAREAIRDQPPTRLPLAGEP